MIYFDEKGSYFNSEARSEKLIKRSFLYVPPLLVGNDKRPIISVQKIEHSYDTSSAKFTLSHAQDHISPVPVHLEISNTALKISLNALSCRHRYYSATTMRDQVAAVEK